MKIKGDIEIQKRVSQKTGNQYRCIVFIDEYGNEQMITADMQSVNNFVAYLYEKLMEGGNDN